MRRDICLPLLALVGGGAGFGLRYWQNASAFDQSTMLYQSGAPATLALLAALAVLAVLTAVLVRGGVSPREYSNAFFCPSSGYMTLMTAGSFLLFAAAGLGFFEFRDQMTLWRMGQSHALPLMLGVTMVLCLPAGVACLILGKGNYRAALPQSFPVLAAAPAYAMLPWIVSVYQENSRQAETLLFVFTILGVIFGALGIYFAACFAFARPRQKVCLFCSVMGAALLLTSLADRPSLFQVVLSMAVVLLLLAQTFALARNSYGPPWPKRLEREPAQNEDVEKENDPHTL